MSKTVKTRSKKETKARKKIQPVPKGYHTLTPYLIIKGASAAIDFYKKALDAKERFRFCGPDGKTIAHAELVVGNSIFMMAEETPHCMAQSPTTLNGCPVGFALYVKDADKAFQRAVDAGAKIKQPLENKFYGDRAGTVQDPFGYSWTLMTHVEDVSMKEMKRRMDELCTQPAQAAA